MHVERFALVLSLAFGLAGRAWAENAHRPPPLPKAAFEACASSRAGDRCTVQHEKDALEGTCRSGPEGGALACLPDRPPKGPPSQPPPEAFTACVGQKDGDACTVTRDGRSDKGLCRSGPDRGPLACVPEMGHRGPRPRPPQAAIDVCKNLAEGTPCAFPMDGREVEGSCHAAPWGGDLGCRPNHRPPPNGDRP